jgi:CP family cyanate transporter-like MFS transporter
MLGLLLVAANLRPSLTGVGPLLGRVTADLGLNSAAAGLLSAVPLLAFAAFSPLAPGLARRLGMERTLVAALFVLATGIALRSMPTATALFAGTAVLGAAIAIGNVLLPALIKRDFATSVGPATSAYVVVMGSIAAVGAGVVVPISDWAPGGWRTALGCWLVPALCAAAFLLPRAARPLPANELAPRRVTSLPWRLPLAWAVTAFIGLQSLGFYVAIAWLPSVLRDHGVGSAAAGWLLFCFQTVGMLAGLILPVLIRRATDQRLLAVGASLVSLLGYLCLLWVPQWSLACSVIAGLGSGASLILALSFMSLRAPDAASAASLSAMAQSVGYLLAACGPAAFGLLHSVTSGWQIPIMLVCAAAVLQAAAGFFAGRGRLPAVNDAVLTRG